MSKQYDYVIIGGGVIGLSVGFTILQKEPHARTLLIEKEDDIARHSSGRNSGVLHAGFYYTADSFKAKFTVIGNQQMTAFCKERGLKINKCGKLVVAQDEQELEQLYELERRGMRNGSQVKIVDEKEAEAIEPNVRTYKKALYSPDTATIDPEEVCRALKNELKKGGIEFRFNTRYRGHEKNTILTNQGEIEPKKIINCAGLYADKVAQDFGFGQAYTMIPFKGLYLKYAKNKTDIGINIYPVPNLKNPFLGVHYTKTITGEIKIGPTATPSFWRENYTMTSNFKFNEFLTTSFYLSKLFLTNSFGFRDLGIDEIKKYNRSYFIGLAAKMVKSIDPNGFGEFTRPGIRAQLLDKTTLNLVQDFVVEGDGKSIHVLNAISPAFTCAFPFAEYLYQNHIAV